MEKRQMLLAIVLVLSIVACFLPWLKVDAAVVGEDPIKRDIYGYDYIVPLGAPYTAPVAIINVIGLILSAYSFKRIKRIRMLNVVAGLLILVGIAASFGYTTSVAFADVSQKGGSFNAWADYGMGLEALFGFIMIIVGAPKVLPSSLSILTTALASCFVLTLTSVLPILARMGLALVGAILALVFGVSFLVTTFYWLSKG